MPTRATVFMERSSNWETMKQRWIYALPFGKGGKARGGLPHYSILEDGDCHNMNGGTPRTNVLWRDDIKYNTFYFSGEGVN